MRRGLTLVEVLVAVVLCGAGLAVVATGISAAVRAEGYAGAVDRAASLAGLLLTRLESGEQPLEDEKGDFEEDGFPEVTWTVEVDTTGDVEGIQTAVITVAWTSQGVERDLILERSFFVDPEVGQR